MDSKALRMLRQVEERTRVAEEAEPTETHLAARMALRPLLALIGKLYPSLKRRLQAPEPLLEGLGESAAQATRVADQRLYINALAAGASTFPGATTVIAEGLALEMDLIAEHRLDAATQLQLPVLQ